MYDLMDFLKLSALLYPAPDEENISSLKTSLPPSVLTSYYWPQDYYPDL